MTPLVTVGDLIAKLSALDPGLQVVTDHPETCFPIEDFDLYRIADATLGEVILISQFAQGDDAVAL